LSKAEQVVREYLAAMERRDLAAARSLLAPGFSMMFPGGKRFDTLEELVEAARKRYRSARKTYERYETARHQRAPLRHEDRRVAVVGSVDRDGVEHRDRSPVHSLS
jgi:ketosteroid isomerase-like protein